jgi:phosphoenolpyruvate carboxykinase (ATP)
MNEFGHKSAQTGLEKIPLSTQGDVFWNLSPAELIEQSLSRGEGCLTDSGALMCDTGKFTGRAPDDKYIVRDKITGHQVWWKEFNHPAEPETFARLKNKMLEFLADKDLFVRDVTACSSEKYRMHTTTFLCTTCFFARMQKH